MITINDFYDVLVAVIPLYFAMFLAFLSVRHFKIFTPDQCSGINRFVAVFAVPLLSFHFISTTNPYTINLHFIFADSLQKLIILFALPFTSRILHHSFDWSITFFSLSTLPNTLVMGIPLLSAMYGSYSGQLMVQVVVLQSIVWYTLMLFLFEYRAARRLVADQFPENSASIVSFRVDGDVESLDAGEGELLVEGEVVENGKIQVVIRRSGSSSRRLSSVAGGEILSVGSSSRVSNFDEKDFGAKGELEEIQVVVAKESEAHLQKSNGKEAEDEEKGAVDQQQKIGSDMKQCERMSGDEISTPRMPPAKVMTRLILVMVWRKLLRNPNTYSSLIGLVWSLVAFRWHIAMPKIIEKSIAILSDAGLGMAMFSLGLFMAMQPRLIACGNRVAAFAMAVRFLMGPAVMAVASVAIGLQGTLFHIAIVQAALPQGIVPFVFAKEYNVHPDVLSTGVIFGMLIALPITILYYILLGL